MAADFAHEPVLAAEVVEALASVPDGTFVDCTLGPGGHAARLLDAHPGLTLLGLDRDGDAVAAATDTLARFGARARVVHARSDSLTDVLAEAGGPPVTAVLADLGVSSHQIDSATRGFSYRDDKDGPLDMRMDPTVGPTAAELLDRMDVDELTHLLRDLGDEPHARRIAIAITEARPLTTTAQLGTVVRAAVPAARRRRGDPAKRTFQALRIAVNDELGILERTLATVIDLLAPQGRFAVLSYHSGEDRLVKSAFRRAADGECTCPPGLPCACGAAPIARLPRRKATSARPAEVAANARATSARLRVLEMHDGPRR